MSSVVVVGAGLGAAHTVSTLREEGFAGPITLVGAESQRPYERPGLSKQVLQGEEPADSLFVHAPEWYAEHDVTTRFGARAVALDRSGRTVRLESGAELGYDTLVLATGARARRLDLPGMDLPGVLTLRTMDDSARLKDELTAGRRLVVVGGGWIGLEVAASARRAGCEVTILERFDLPLGAILGERVARHFAELHRAHGVDLRTNVEVTGFKGGSSGVTGVRVGDEVVPGDLVLVGAGAIPNAELAGEAGLEVKGGVVVDERLRSPDPAVLAIGDVANAFNPTLGRSLRVEHWDNAIRQGQLAARTILGQAARYDWQPYFFTDQYELGMEYVGHASGEDDVVLRGDMDSGEFIAFWLSSGTVRAAMNVNIWDVNDTLRGLVGRVIPPGRLADPDVPLTEL